MRLNPEVWALVRQVRRPTLTVLAGVMLIAPWSLVPAGERPVAPAAEVEMADAVAPEAMAQARDAVASAWRDRILYRERARVAEQYASRFRIPIGLAEDIHWAAQKERIDPHLAFRLVRAESSFRTTAVSPVGAVGLTQVMPATANWLVPGTAGEDLLDARFNLRIGFRYLRKLMDMYGDAELALLAYNRGPGVVDSMLDEGLDPDNGYSEMVLTGDRTRHQEHIAAQAAARAATPEPPARRGASF